MQSRDSGEELEVTRVQILRKQRPGVWSLKEKVRKWDSTVKSLGGWEGWTKAGLTEQGNKDGGAGAGTRKWV